MNQRIRRGIRTVYRGIQFRSRLEACYACFFDQCRWERWEYEPRDLSGYVADFVITFDHAPLLVEIKPANSLEELQPELAKIEQSGWEREALITLAAPTKDPTPVLGLIAERELIGRELVWQWSPARLFVCLSCGCMSVLAEDGFWRCRVCGVDGGNAHVGHLDADWSEWTNAKNRVQWRAEL